MEPVASMRMVARWATEAVTAYETGDERQAERCYAFMFAAVVHADPEARRIMKAGLDRGQRGDVTR